MFISYLKNKRVQNFQDYHKKQVGERNIFLKKDKPISCYYVIKRKKKECYFDKSNEKENQKK